MAEKLEGKSTQGAVTRHAKRMEDKKAIEGANRKSQQDLKKWSEAFADDAWVVTSALKTMFSGEVKRPLNLSTRWKAHFSSNGRHDPSPWLATGFSRIWPMALKTGLKKMSFT